VARHSATHNSDRQADVGCIRDPRTSAGITPFPAPPGYKTTADGPQTVAGASTVPLIQVSSRCRCNHSWINLIRHPLPPACSLRCSLYWLTPALLLFSCINSKQNTSIIPLSNGLCMVGRTTCGRIWRIAADCVPRIDGSELLTCASSTGSPAGTYRV
jgi:hypothetical protein